MKVFRINPKVTIELTALVDVLFLLLIFFMFSYTQNQLRGYEVEIPVSSESETLSSSEKTFILTLHEDGRIVIDGDKREVPLDQLAEELVFLDTENTKLVVRAHNSVPLYLLVQVFDEIKRSGIQKAPFLETEWKKNRSNKESR